MKEIDNLKSKLHENILQRDKSKEHIEEWSNKHEAEA